MQREKPVDLLRELISLFLVVGLVVAFFFELIADSQVPLFRDLGPIFYPMRFSLAHSLHAGEFPLWDSQLAMGFPLLANFQAGAFYAPNLVYLALPFWSAVRTTFVFHFVVAAVGAYWLGRYWGWSRSVAVIGSVLFCFSGCIISLLNLLNHLQTAVWLPWVVLSSEKLFRFRSKWAFLSFVIVAATQLFAGSPEFYVMSMSLVFLNGLKLMREIKLPLRSILLPFLVGNGFVVGLSMCQILPSMELIREATRFRAPSYGSSTFWSLHPASLVNLLFLDKEVDQTSFARFQSFFDLPSPFLMTLYLGALFPFGMSNWFLTARKAQQRCLLGVLLLTLTLSLGSYAPFYDLLYRYVPLTFLSRFPEKIFFMALCLLIYAALQGLAELLRESNGPKSCGYLIGPAILCAVLLVCDVGLQIRKDVAAALSVKDIPALLFSLERQMVLLFCVGLLFFLRQRRRIQASLFQGLLVAVAFSDLYAAHKPYQFLARQDLLSKRPEALALLEGQDFYRLFYVSSPLPLHPVAALFSGAKSPADQGSFALETLRPNTGRFWGVGYIQDIDALSRRSYSLFLEVAGGLPRGDLIRLLARMNAKYVVSLTELRAEGITLLAHLAKHPSWFYRIEEVTPRAYVVAHARYEEDPKQTVTQLATQEFDPAQVVLLDEPVDLPETRDFFGMVKILSYKNQQVSLLAVVNAPAVLILTDAFAPGWKVYVNGTERRIQRANYFFRAVLLPAGQSRIFFQYEPDSLRRGIIVTVVSASLLVGVAIARPSVFAL